MKYLMILSMLVGCSGELLIYNPHDPNVPLKLSNLANVQRLDHSKCQGDFKVAYIADTHLHHRDLKKIVYDINSRDDIAFTVVLGDITDSSTRSEYLGYFDIINRSKRPHFTVLGNHDAIGFGEDMYRSLFGPPNLSFMCGDQKFVLFNSNVWETGTPDWPWLKGESKDAVIGMHVPIYHNDEAYSADTQAKYLSMILENNVKQVMLGHWHHSYVNSFENIPHQGVDDVTGGYTTMTISGIRGDVR